MAKLEACSRTRKRPVVFEFSLHFAAVILLLCITEKCWEIQNTTGRFLVWLQASSFGVKFLYLNFKVANSQFY